MRQILDSYLYQFNVPKSKSGLMNDVRYEVRDHAGTVIISSTNSGVIELGVGSYGVDLSFDIAGGYSIHWELLNTPYVANEDIAIYDFKSNDVCRGIYGGYPG